VWCCILQTIGHVLCDRSKRAVEFHAWSDGERDLRRKGGQHVRHARLVSVPATILRLWPFVRFAQSRQATDVQRHFTELYQHKGTRVWTTGQSSPENLKNMLIVMRNNKLQSFRLPPKISAGGGPERYCLCFLKRVIGLLDELKTRLSKNLDRGWRSDSYS